MCGPTAAVWSLVRARDNQVVYKQVKGILGVRENCSTIETNRGSGDVSV